MAKRILLIDDEKDLVKTVAFRLEENGYEVISAYDGQEGLDKAEKEKPDLILLDIMMPVMDGFQVLHILRNNPETQFTPIIIFSAKGDTKSLLKAQDMDSTDYIIKPFDLDDLLDLIERYI